MFWSHWELSFNWPLRKTYDTSFLLGMTQTLSGLARVHLDFGVFLSFLLVGELLSSFGACLSASSSFGTVSMLVGLCQGSVITVNVPLGAGRVTEWPQSWWRSYFLPLICFNLMLQFPKVLTTTLGRTEYDPIVCWESAPSWQKGPTWLHRETTSPTLLSREIGVRVNILVL